MRVCVCVAYEGLHFMGTIQNVHAFCCVTTISINYAHCLSFLFGVIAMSVYMHLIGYT